MQKNVNVDGRMCKIRSHAKVENWSSLFYIALCQYMYTVTEQESNQFLENKNVSTNTSQVKILHLARKVFQGNIKMIPCTQNQNIIRKSYCV